MKDKHSILLIISGFLLSLFTKPMNESSILILPGFELGLFLITFISLATLAVSFRKKEQPDD